MKTEIDKSEITQELLKRYGKFDTDTVHTILQLLDLRINLPGHGYTTMCTKEWLSHLRKELVNYLDIKDKAEENNDRHMRIALSNMLDAYENPEY